MNLLDALTLTNKFTSVPSIHRLPLVQGRFAVWQQAKRGIPYNPFPGNDFPSSPWDNAGQVRCVIQRVLDLSRRLHVIPICLFVTLSIFPSDPEILKLFGAGAGAHPAHREVELNAICASSIQIFVFS